MPAVSPVLLTLALHALPGAPEGEVKVPVDRGDRLEAEATPKPPESLPSVPSAALDRTIS